MTHDAHLISFIRSSLLAADTAFIDDFVSNGPIPGGANGAARYLLAVALHDVDPTKLASICGVSLDTAQYLKDWLDSGTRCQS